MKNLPHIVIAGFGETGVLTAIHLNDNYPGRYRITAISTKASLFSGQELGSRLSTPQSWSKNYHTRFEDYTYLRQVERCHGAVESVDSVKQTIEVNVFGKAAETLHYDVLLIASGVSNGFWRDAKVEADANLKKNLHDYAQKFKAAQHIAIVGGGPSGASCAYQLKTTYPDKRIQFYFSGERPLPHHHPRTQKKVLRQLLKSELELFSQHRAASIPEAALSDLPIQWSTGQASVSADLVLWTVGHTRPNSDFLPPQMLDQQGFVKTNKHLQVSGLSNVFCVGDIANTDKNRSSARNFAHRLVAHNIHCYLSGRSAAYKTYQAPKYRWGSVLGVQADGLRVFTAKGGVFRFPFWSIQRVLFPYLVDQFVYRGVLRDKKQSMKAHTKV